MNCVSFFLVTQPSGAGTQERARTHMGRQPAQAGRRPTKVGKKPTQVGKKPTQVERGGLPRF